MRVVALVALLASACCQSAIRPKTEAEALQQLARSVVQVDTDESLGSGTIVYSRGRYALVLTCLHVINDKTSITVTSSQFLDASATVEKSDPITDLALLKVDVPEQTPLRVARRDPDLYERVFLIGSPLGEYGTISAGFISSKDRPLKSHPEYPSRWLVSGAATISGLSGGAVINHRGELVCVPEIALGTEKQSYPELGLCVSRESIRDFLKGYGL